MILFEVEYYFTDALGKTILENKVNMALNLYTNYLFLFFAKIHFIFVIDPTTKLGRDKATSCYPMKHF